MNEHTVRIVHSLVAKVGRGASFVATYLLGAAGIPIMAVMIGLAAHVHEAYAWQYDLVSRSWPQMTPTEQASIRRVLREGHLTEAAVNHVKKSMNLRGQQVVGGGGSQAELLAQRARLEALALPHGPAGS